MGWANKRKNTHEKETEVRGILEYCPSKSLVISFRLAPQFEI